MTQMTPETKRNIEAAAVRDMIDYAQAMIDAQDGAEEVSAEYAIQRNLLSIMRRRAQTLYDI